jgi:hypothetical protein
MPVTLYAPSALVQPGTEQFFIAHHPVETSGFQPDSF